MNNLDGYPYGFPTSSDWAEAFVCPVRQLDDDLVAGPHLAAVQDDTHDTGLADEVPVLVAV